MNESVKTLIPNGLTQESPWDWPVRTTILHQRVIYPHLHAIYDDLPARARIRICKDQALQYDQNINRARAIIRQVTGQDRELLEDLTNDLGAEAWQTHRSTILLDVAKDAMEGTLAAASFYLRLGVWTLGGDREFERIFQADGTSWTYTRLAQFHPALSATYLGVSAASFVLASALSVLYLRQVRRAGRLRVPARWLLAAVPLIAFATVNAAAFAATQKLVHIRYALAAHTICISVVYLGALAWAGLLSPRGEQHR